MPPVKPKKLPQKNLPIPAVLPPVNDATRPEATPAEALNVSSSAAQSPTQTNLPPAANPTEVADQLHSAAIHLLRRLRVRDRESGVGPAQLSALSVLVFAGPKSLGELAGAEQVRPPTMSRIVASLQRAKLVRRHATDDGRRVRLEATPKGVSLMWESRQRRVGSLTNVVEALNENEKRQLQDAVALLRQVIRQL
jgi:DNA-binding MarR family transcriptional regulator